MAGHGLDAMRACVEAKLSVDFYQKTFHSLDYYTAPKPEEKKACGDHDNSWCNDPDAVIARIHALGALRANKLRSFLTLLGILIGTYSSIFVAAALLAREGHEVAGLFLMGQDPFNIEQHYYNLRSMAFFVRFLPAR